MLHSSGLGLVQGLLQPSHENPKLPELVQEGFVRQVCNVLGIVVGLVCCASLVDLLEVLGLVRVDSLQNAQPPATGGSQTLLLLEVLKKNYGYFFGH